jgi:hypothetical protein
VSRGDAIVHDEATVRIFAHRQNIRRYRALLRTNLTVLERSFIDQRIAEEVSEIRQLSEATAANSGIR